VGIVPSKDAPSNPAEINLRSLRQGDSAVSHTIETPCPTGTCLLSPPLIAAHTANNNIS
jgi:hypothetical protein